MTAYNWTDLKELGQWDFACQKATIANTFNTQTLVNTLTSSCNDLAFDNIDRVIVTQRGRYLLATFNSNNAHSSNRPGIYIIDISSLSSDTGGKATSIAIAPDILAKIKQPIDILENDLLVFLNESHWLCTWRLGLCHSETTISTSPSTSVGANAITKHFFLPRDWVRNESVRLCHVLPDKTFLYPRKGTVAVIKSNLGSAW
jgi:hypothetical protein